VEDTIEYRHLDNVGLCTLSTSGAVLVARGTNWRIGQFLDRTD